VAPGSGPRLVQELDTLLAIAPATRTASSLKERRGFAADVATASSIDAGNAVEAAAAGGDRDDSTRRGEDVSATKEARIPSGVAAVLKEGLGARGSTARVAFPFITFARVMIH